MKLPIIAVLFYLAVSLFAQPNKRPAQDQQSAAKKTQPAPASPDNPKPATDTKEADSSPPHWYASSEWWLVVIAAFTALAITYQAREMKRATEAMKESNRAAMLSAQTLVNSERPWLSVKFEGGNTPPRGFSYVQISLVNSGKSAARVLSCTFEEDDFLFPRSELPASPIYKENPSWTERFIAPGDSLQIKWYVLQGTPFQDLREERCRKKGIDPSDLSQKAYYIVYGRIRYTDGDLDGVVRETRYCFFHDTESQADYGIEDPPGGRWIQVARPEYNHYT